MADAQMPEETRDLWTETGAAVLKRKIETYWADRGMPVQVMLIEGPFSSALRNARVDVRSDMINGMPRAACAKAAMQR